MSTIPKHPHGRALWLNRETARVRYLQAEGLTHRARKAQSEINKALRADLNKSKLKVKGKT